MIKKVEQTSSRKFGGVLEYLGFCKMSSFKSGLYFHGGKFLGTRRKGLNEKGMTLIEIMIVLAILASIGGLVATQAISQLKKSRVRSARIAISELGKALDTYYTDCGSYPSSLESLMSDSDNCSNWGPEPYVKKIPKDPWGNDFIYEPDGSSYEVVSLGQGGQEGGEGYEKDVSSDDE